MIVFFPLHKIMKYKKKRYDHSDHFYCCFRNRAVSHCLGIFVSKTKFACMHRLNLAANKKIEELVYTSAVSTKSAIILKDSLII